MRLEVRCCCQPQKLMGWVEVPDPRSGRRFTFALRRPLPPLGDIYQESTMPCTHITLPIATIRFPETGGERLAVKAEGVPLHVLREIVGFEEAQSR